MHRDIKPENIMLRADGLVKVLDFGVAKVTKPEEIDGKAITWEQIFSRPGVIMGTAAYMSPEQARGKRLDARTDIFSAGVVLYELLTGRPPFRGLTATDIVAALIQDDVPAASLGNPNVPHELDRTLRRMLEKDRNDRYATVADVLEDLDKIDGESDRPDAEGGPAAEVEHAAEAATEPLRNYTSVLLLIAVVVIFVLIVYILFFQIF